MVALTAGAYSLMDAQFQALFFIVWMGPALIVISFIALFCGFVTKRWRATRIPNYDQYGPTNASHPMHPNYRGP